MTHPANTPASGGDEPEIRLPLYSITAESLLRDAWSMFGGNMRDADYWHAFSDATNFALSQIAAALAAQPPKADGGVVQAFLPQPNETREDKLLREGLEWRDMYIRASAERDRLLDAAAPPLNTGPEVGGGGEKWEPGVAYMGHEDCKRQWTMGDVTEWFDLDVDPNLLVDRLHPTVDAYKDAAAALAPALARLAPAEAGEDLAGLRKALGDLAELTIWMSGSADFSREGVAGEGWRNMKPALDRALDVLAAPIVTPAASQALDLPRQGPLDWAVGRWKAEVANRPLRNVHRRALDTTWRQVIHHFGGNPDALVGPAHDDLVADAPAASRPAGGRTDFEAKLKQLLHWHLRPDFTRDAIDSLEHEILCLLLNPSDDTRAGGDQAQEGGR